MIHSAKIEYLINWPIKMATDNANNKNNRIILISASGGAVTSAINEVNNT